MMSANEMVSSVELQVLGGVTNHAENKYFFKMTVTNRVTRQWISQTTSHF